MPTNYNRANLITESATLFPDNNTQEISPADLRQWLEDGTTSFVTQKDKSTLENAIFENKASTLASGATVDLNTATGNYLHISGTSTINSFGTCPAGARFIIVFDAAATLTYNATSLIIPGLANKTAATGDCCMIVSEGSGNWRIVGYFSISGGGGGGSGSVTSVDLTMPSAFAVSGNPITTAGTLAVTGAGLNSQYVRGDGTLANFPTSTGGGSSVSYYLNGSITQLTISGDTYYQMSKTPVFGSGTNFTRTSASGDGYIASFITDAGDPNILSIPGGNFNLEFYFNASSGGGSPQFYAEIYKYDGASLTLIGSGSTNPEGITSGTTVDQYFTSVGVPTTALALTDRLVVRIYVITSGRNIILHTEDNNLCQVITTISTGLTALNGLTAQVQTFATGTSGTDFNISSSTNTHTFNIPDASDTARGLITTSAQTFGGVKTFGNGTSAGEIRFLEPSGSGVNYVALKSQATTADYSITLPPAAPSGAQYLQSTGVGGVLQWTSGTTTGVSSIGTINSATKNPNGAVISGSNIIMQTADATNVGLVSIGTQTFAGAKTFSDAVTMSAAGSTTVAQLTFSGTTNNWINFGQNGANNPTTPTVGALRSTGTKVVLYANSPAANLDAALGVSGEATGGVLWLSSANNIKFFASNVASVEALNIQYSTNVRGIHLSAATNATNTIPQLLVGPISSSVGSQYIGWPTTGSSASGPPLIGSTRSAGTKLVFNSNITTSLLDVAIGLGGETTGGSLWLSSAGPIRFYTGDSTTAKAVFDGTASESRLTLTNATAVSIIAATATTANVFNTVATTINIGASASSINIGPTFGGTFTVNSNTVVGSQATIALWNTTSTNISFAGAATTLAIGNTATTAQTVNMFTASTGASTYNFATGATASATTKAINIGTGGAAGSTTNIIFGTSTTTNLRFFGSTNTSGKPTVTLSRGGNLALGSLLTALANLGLITDSTTA